MKHTPVYVEENFNVGTRTPFRDGVVLVGGVIAALAAIWFLLGIVVDVGAAYLPVSVEMKLGGFFDAAAGGQDPGTGHRGVQRVLDNLLAELPDSTGYRLKIMDVKEANAFALPGRTIVVTAGLIENSTSENELAMVLGHELGHFHHRHHIKALGRSALLLVAAAVFSLSDDAVASLSGGTGSLLEKGFSREQEDEADEFGLRLLSRAYGHAGGATDFFERIRASPDDPGLLAFASTHPASADRIERIEAIIARDNLPLEQCQPLP